MKDLDALIAAVEAGTAAYRHFLAQFDTPCQDVALQALPGDACDAYRGSLDAAHRLHEALLPGWQVCEFSQTASVGEWWCSLWSERCPNYDGYLNPVASRAWLLAILHALKDQGETS